MKKHELPRRGVIAAALCTVLVTACGPSKPPAAGGPKQQAQPSLTVSLATPQQQQWAQKLSASGNVMPWQEAIIGSEVGGVRITRVAVNVGDRVRRGQVLARLNDATVQADVQSAQASLAEAEANLAQAAAAWERAKRMAPAGGVSQQDLVAAETQHRTATARVSAARAQLKNQQLRLQFTTVVAPDDGVISARAAAEGAVAQAGGELFRLIRGGRLEWRAEARADALLRIVPGQKVDIVSPLGTPIVGRVREVAPSVDLTSRMGLVYVDLPGEAPAKAGSYLTGSFTLGESSALTLPLAAVAVRDGKNFAFSVDKQGRVVALELKLGRTQGDRVEVLEGLRPQDSVVAEGAGFLKPGDVVKVVPAGAR